MASVTPYRRGSGPKRNRQHDGYLITMGVVLLLVAVMGLLGIFTQDTPESTENTSPPTAQSDASPLPSGATGSAGAVSTADSSAILGTTIQARFAPPPGFERVEVTASSFGQWLRSLPLKPDGSPVLLYDGTEKTHLVHLAVVDMDVGERDLQQCADSIMRLRAEWMWANNRQEEISFHFTNGFNCEYSRWRRGYRIQLQDNDVQWVKTAEPDSGYLEFRNYLNAVFTYAGTKSLQEETQEVHWINMLPGDIIVEGGSPGHAVLVADMAINRQTGERVYMLLQGFMPAQEMHIIKNPVTGDAWYSLGSEDVGVATPEWTFSAGTLRRYN